MKVSLNWIREYVDVSLDLPSLLDLLTRIGLVPDSWEEKGGDTLLDIGTYANRPDTLGHLGVAREIAAALELPLKMPACPIVQLDEKTADIADVQVWDEELCPRYCGVLVKNVSVGPSPDWLREKVEAMGLNSINNAVDATNYVLFATAQPIHAFDFAKISGGKVIVRRAKKGETLRCLDGRDASLTPEMLVIADESRPIALAGVIGGEESAISETTRDIFIESAYFDPVSIRKTSKALGYQTDASYRFERGADISFPPQAALLAASLLTQFGGKATQGILDIYPSPRKKKELLLRHSRVGGLLGTEISPEFIHKVLLRLGFDLTPQGNQSWIVKVPYHRVDIEREADLIEEIARFYGYDRIPSVLPPLKVIERFEEDQDRVDKIRNALLSQGFDEMINPSFSDPEKEVLFGSLKKPIEIRNPISTRASQMRTTLLSGILESISRNLNRGLEGAHVFELGNVYFWEGETPREVLELGLAAAGQRGGPHWQGKGEEADFFSLKGSVESVMSLLRYEPYYFEREDNPAMEKGFCLSLYYKGARVGFLGKITAPLLEAFSIKKPVFACELNLAFLLEKKPRPFVFTSLGRFPSVTRDLSFLVPKDVSYQRVREEVEKISLPYLERFELVDRFSGPPLLPTQVSLSFRFVFRHPQATLQAADVDRQVQQIVTQLRSSLGLQLREGKN